MIPPRITTATMASTPMMAAFGTRGADAGEGNCPCEEVCAETRTSRAREAEFCVWVEAETGWAAPAPASEPHLVQNFVPDASAAPHFVQNCDPAAAALEVSRCAPHFVQNASRSVSAAPHFLQLFPIAISAPVDRQKRAAIQSFAQRGFKRTHFLILEIS